ncbi:MAG: leucine-rich repeat protein [Blautia sp.]
MIPDSVTSVGEETFSDNDSLRKVALSKEMTEISSGMFDGCDGLQELEIPENIRKFQLFYLFRTCSCNGSRKY